MNDFIAFPKIGRTTSLLRVCVTQKIHGSNAQILITEDGDFKVGSRTRWITPESDNYGCARWAYDNRDELVAALGPGRHYGEWAGPGINSGEGLDERSLVLFDVHRWPPERPRPPRVLVVPVLYRGNEMPDVAAIMDDLKQTGSRLVPGYTHPEGVVVEVNGVRTKFTFAQEDVAWKRGDERYAKARQQANNIDVSLWLHEVRMAKVFTADEERMRAYPQTLPAIVDAYVADLVAECEVPATALRAIRTGAYALARHVATSHGDAQ